MFSFEKDSKENLGNELSTEPDMCCVWRNLVYQTKQNEIKQNKIIKQSWQCWLQLGKWDQVT